MNDFLNRMKGQLPDFEEYEACLHESPYKGIRVNTLKISVEEFQKISPFALERVPWEENGFYISEEKPGKSVWHDAGLFYSQEPSAMCAVPLLDVQPGERVLDLCSAPGSKGTQLAQRMQGRGILVVNEKMPDRAKILLQNIERMGVCNAVVTNADPETLAERLGGYFDKILVDAPCSGEGMFRKEAEAPLQWSADNVTMCAERQRKILTSAAKMLAPCGKLVYSTCTFSEEEDERNAEWFVREFPEMTLCEQKKIYPHRERGEGHFAVLFQKDEQGYATKVRPFKSVAEKRTVALWKEFERGFLRESLQGQFLSFGGNLCIVPEDLFALNGLRVLRAGLLLGENVGGRFEPAHALAMGVSKDNLQKVAPVSESELEQYFHGEQLETKGVRGWCAVTYGGYALGLGKDGNALKNHYPKGLRR